MSIIFKPKIPKVFSFGSGKKEDVKPKKVKLIERPKIWKESEIKTLVELRALRVPIKECTQILKHSYQTCCQLSQRDDLSKKINNRRAELIKEAIK